MGSDRQLCGCAGMHAMPGHALHMLCSRWSKVRGVDVCGRVNNVVPVPVPVIGTPLCVAG